MLRPTARRCESLGSGLSGAPPAAGLAADARSPRRPWPTPGRRAATARSSAACCRSARSTRASRPTPDVSDPPAADAGLDRGLLRPTARCAPEHRDTMRRMLAAIAAPAGFAFVEEAGQPMAMAIGAVQGDHMGLFDVLVMPQARRRGLARKVTESLYAWAWRPRRALRLSAGRRHQRSGDAALRRAGLPHRLRLRVSRPPR